MWSLWIRENLCCMRRQVNNFCKPINEWSAHACETTLQPNGKQSPMKCRSITASSLIWVADRASLGCKESHPSPDETDRCIKTSQKPIKPLERPNQSRPVFCAGSKDSSRMIWFRTFATSLRLSIFLWQWRCIVCVTRVLLSFCSEEQISCIFE